MKLAFVYDRVNKFGGAEQVLLALHEIWPEAPLYTAVYDKKTAGWAKIFQVIPSFLQYVPFAKEHHEFYPWLTPLAFESFNLDNYDVVISVTSAEAKAIITKPKTLHICYCLTPTRYLWSGYDSYIQEPGLGILSRISRVLFLRMYSTLKKWDLIACQRPDLYVAISQVVKTRIQDYYNRSVDEVIYPPVDTSSFTSLPKKHQQDAPYLVVSRLVSYKRIDLVIDACNHLKLPLLIIGNGKDAQRLMNKAGNTVRFITKKLTTEELAAYYQNCRAFIFAGEEDFGIVAGEAQSCGKPVLCYKNSGMAEIIKPGVTGEVFEHQTVDSLVEALSRFHPEQYNSFHCRQQARCFDIVRFKQHMKMFVTNAYRLYVERVGA